MTQDQEKAKPDFAAGYSTGDLADGDMLVGMVGEDEVLLVRRGDGLVNSSPHRAVLRGVGIVISTIVFAAVLAGCGGPRDERAAWVLVASRPCWIAGAATFSDDTAMTTMISEVQSTPSRNHRRSWTLGSSCSRGSTGGAVTRASDML